MIKTIITFIFFKIWLTEIILRQIRKIKKYIIYGEKCETKTISVP